MSCFIKRRRWLQTLAFGLLGSCLLAGSSRADDAATSGGKPRILFLTQSVGYKHGSVDRRKGDLSPAEIAITQLAQTSGAFTVACTQDAAADFTKESLKNYDIVWFYTTSRPPRAAQPARPAKDGKPAVPAQPAQPAVGLPIPKDVLDYFFSDWLKQKGHGFIGSHSASDTFHDYEPYWDMIGGTFSGHPWNSSETVTITNHDPEHPTMHGWAPEFQIKDEIYQYSHWQPEKVRVLMSLNMAKCKTKKPYHVPVAWVKQYGEGRIYYNNLGHNDATWQNKTFLDSLVHAIGWVSGKTAGTAEPNPEVSKKEEANAREAAAAVEKK